MTDISTTSADAIIVVQPEVSPEAVLDSLFVNTPGWWTDGTFAQVAPFRANDGSPERYSRIQALWVRVIVRAAFDLASHRDDRKLACKKWALEAEKWLFDKSYLFNSFENVCAMLGIDPEKFRLWAKSLTKEKVRKMEHMERANNVSRPSSDADIFAIIHRRFQRG